MTRYTQTGEYNCLATSLGCLLDLDPRQVAVDGMLTDWREEIHAWLAPRGLALLTLDLPADAGERGVITRYWGYHLVIGDSPMGGRHCVVGYRGAVHWDPHPARAGLSGGPADWTYGLLVATLA